jgi:hypothetical protein
MLTGIKEIDIEILFYLEDETLNKLCKNNQHIRFLASSIWLKRIRLLYHNIPVAANIDYHKFYWNTKDSYKKLESYAIKNVYQDILE